MTDIATVARKEILELRRDRLFLILIGFLAVVTVISVAVGAADFRAQLDAYNTYVAEVAASGSGVTPAAPQLFPLQLLRGGIEYLEILGALFAIVLGYATVAKEKHRGTLPLLLSRPVQRFALAGGKIAALAAVWGVVVLALAVVSAIAVTTIGGGTLGGTDLVRLALSCGFAWLYLVFWSAIAITVTVLTRQLSAGLIISLVIWLAFVLVIPQIGDTMDPDNQVPAACSPRCRSRSPTSSPSLPSSPGSTGSATAWKCPRSPSTSNGSRSRSWASKTSTTSNRCPWCGWRCCPTS